MDKDKIIYMPLCPMCHTPMPDYCYCSICKAITVIPWILFKGLENE